MREIVLTRNKVAVVDDEDYEWLSRWKWYAHKPESHREQFYAARTDYSSGEPVMVYMHREIAARIGLPQVDHHNGNGLHNWRSNLRPCTQNQNNGNQRKQLGTSSCYKGVSWDEVNGKWEANIKINGKKKRLGRFVEERQAAIAYNTAACEVFGEFARLNTV